MPKKDLYRLDGKLQLLSSEEAELARPASLMRITKRSVGAEVPLHLSQPRVGRELRAGDVIVVERYRAPAYRDVAETFQPEADAAAVKNLLRLPNLDPAISAYLTQALEPPASEQAATKEATDGEGQGAPRKKRTKSGS